jgi:hypothetical protein
MAPLFLPLRKSKRFSNRKAFRERRAIEVEKQGEEGCCVSPKFLSFGKTHGKLD